MKINEKLMIYWTFNTIEDDFNIKSNKKTMTMISIDITWTTINLWMFQKWLMTFISNIQEKCIKKQHSCKHE